MKCLFILVRNGIGTMVVRGLDDGEKGLVLVTEYPIGFQEEVLIADAPNVDLGRLEVFLFVNLQPLDIVGEQSPDIGPAGAAAEKVIFIITLEIADDGMLIHRGRVAAGSGGGNTHVGDTRNHRPYAAGRSVAWRKTMVEE